MDLRRLCFSVSICIAASAGTPPAVDFSKTPIAFEPNRGQAEAPAVFIASGGNYRLTLEPSGSRLQLRGTKGHTEIVSTLVNAKPAHWQPELPLPGHSSHFRGQDSSKWLTGLPNYGRVRAAGIFPGIDVIYYGTGRQLEYDFVVSPGANAGAIRMKFTGAQSVALDSEGNLLLHTPAGDLMQKHPIAYQVIAGTRHPVASRFQLAKNGEVGFELGAYNRSAALTIDPTLVYASFLGGTDTDSVNAVVADAAGNLYVSGVTFSTSAADADLLVRKFAPNGTQIYNFDLGGSGDDYGNGMAVDSVGSVYLGGRTTSADFPVASAYQKGRAGGSDAFVLSVNPAGTAVYFSTYLGGSGDDICYGIAIDATGAVYLGGSTVSTDFPTSSNAYQTKNRGGIDGFVAKFDRNGAPVFSTLVGGGSDDNAYGIAVDSAGNSYLAGSSNSDSFPQTNNPFQRSRHGGLDAFVTEVNSAGTNLIYSTFLGGGADDIANGIAVDAKGSAYVVGTTASSDYPTTSGAYKTSYQGGTTDIFVTKLNPGQGSLAYSTYLGSHGVDEGWAIAVDAAGVAYIAGDTDSDQYPVTGDAIQSTRRGNREAVISKLNTAGNSLISSTFLGGAGDDIAYAITIDPATNIYVGGATSSANFPVTANSFQGKPGGGSTDGFFALINYAGTGPSGSTTISNGGIVNGGNFAVGPVAPGSVVSVFGSNFVGTAVSAGSVPLPTSLGGVSVSINGIRAPLFYVGPNQINLQLPYEVTPGSASIQVTGPGGTSSTLSFSVAQTAPALLISNGRAIVVNQDGTINGPSNPAHAGNVVVAYLTGIGPVNAATQTGAGSPLATSTLTNSITVGGTPAAVSYLGLTPGSIGLAQANFTIPRLTSADYSLALSINGVPSQSALIAVAP